MSRRTPPDALFQAVCLINNKCTSSNLMSGGGAYKHQAVPGDSAGRFHEKGEMSPWCSGLSRLASLPFAPLASPPAAAAEEKSEVTDSCTPLTVPHPHPHLPSWQSGVFCLEEAQSQRGGGGGEVTVSDCCTSERQSDPLPNPPRGFGFGFHRLCSVFSPVRFSQLVTTCSHPPAPSRQ